MLYLTGDTASKPCDVDGNSCNDRNAKTINTINTAATSTDDSNNVNPDEKRVRTGGGPTIVLDEGLVTVPVQQHSLPHDNQADVNASARDACTSANVRVSDGDSDKTTSKDRSGSGVDDDADDALMPPGWAWATGPALLSRTDIHAHTDAQARIDTSPGADIGTAV